MNPHAEHAPRWDWDAPLEPRRATQLANFENHTELAEKFCRLGSGRTGGAMPEGCGRHPAFECCTGGRHGDAADREGWIRGGWSWAGDDENRQKYVIFGLSSMVCQLDGKPFLGRRNVPYRYFLNFSQFF